MPLCYRQDTLDADGAVFQAGLVVHAVAVAGKTDEVFQPGIGGLLDALPVNLHQRVVMLQPVECLANTADPGFAVLERAGWKTDHGAHEAVLAHRREIGRVEQLDRLHAETGRLGRQFLQAGTSVAPLADRVTDIALHFAFSRMATRWEGQGRAHGGSAASDRFKRRAAREFGTVHGLSMTRRLNEKTPSTVNCFRDG